jgi:hypothetical protein
MAGSTVNYVYIKLANRSIRVFLTHFLISSSCQKSKKLSRLSLIGGMPNQIEMN